MRNFFLSLIILHFAVLTSFADRRKTEVEDLNVLKVRGVMESYKSVSEGLVSRLEMYAEAGLTHYFYCPTDDKYCNRWGWKFVYNDTERHALRTYISLCQSKSMDFVWTVNVSDNYKWTREDYEHLLNKLVIMYYNGVRNFAVLFPDEPSVIAPTAKLLNLDFTAKVPENVNVFIINDIPVVQYPSESDVAKTLMKGYHFDSDFKAKALSSGAVLCRLTLSDAFVGIPLAAAMDYASDPEKYQPDRCIAEGIADMSDEVKEAFLTFLRHTGGVDESADVNTFAYDEWTSQKGEELYLEFDRIEKVPSILESAAGSSIMDALRPWLVEFGRLGTRGKKVLECIRHYNGNDIGAFWISFMENRMTEEEILSYRFYPVGGNKLQPFCENAMKGMLDAFAARLNVDSDLRSSVSSAGHIEYRIPQSAVACRLLTGRLPENETVLFRQIAADGSLVAEFVVKSPYTEFDLKKGAVKVDVLGDVDIYETIFVYL